MQLKACLAALVAVPICAHAAAVNQSRNITVRGPTSLDKDVADSFLSCLNATEVRYALYIDEGVTIVHPVVNRTIDFDGADEHLFSCMMLSVQNMSIAAEDFAASENENTHSIHASRATFPWLVSHGAVGLQVIGTQKPGSSLQPDSSLASWDVDEMQASRLLKRSVSHFWAYVSDYKSCASSDLLTPYVNECHTYNQAYASVKFENPSLIYYLEVEIWPHHRCEKGQARKIVIYPLESSECHTRTTYSFYGRYTTKKSALSWLSGSTNL